WRSRLLPFTRLSCRMFVPPSTADTCPLVASSLLPPELAGQPGFIIGMHEALDMLRQNDAQQLSVAIQAALDAIQSTAVVEPGEPYVAAQAGPSPTPAIAPQPLRAVRGYRFVNPDGSPEPCILARPAVPCRFPGQDCALLCSVQQPPASAAPSARTWIAAALVRSMWSYYAADNHAVALQVPE